MWISEIKINNFRPFYKEQKFIFNEDSQEKFTIIEAKSDTGKTTFLSAICWCLYGKDLGEYGIIDDKAKDSMHPFNLERKSELDDGAIDEMKVEITLNNDGDKKPKYIIRRIAKCAKHGKKMIFEGDISLKITEWDDRNQANPINDSVLCQKVVNSILPEDIHMFFLFEGEKLEKYFSFHRPENIQAAIEKVSQIQHVKTSLKHLEAVRDKIFTRKVKGLKDTDLAKTENLIELSKKKRDELESKKSNYIFQLENADERINVIDNILTKVNKPLIEKWAEERIALEESNEKLEEELLRLREDNIKLILEIAPLAICCKTLEKLLNQIEDTSNKNELPPKIRTFYIKELLERKTCICGRSLDKSKDEVTKKATKAIEEILNQKDYSDSVVQLVEGKFVIKNILSSIPQKLIKTRKTIYDKIKALDIEIKSNIANIEQLNENLKTYNEKQISGLNVERQYLQSSKTTQMRSIAQLEIEIKQEQENITKYRRDRDELAKSLKDYDEKKKLADFLDSAHKHLEKINQEVLIEVGDKVEEKTFSSFKNLHWDKENYSEFIIDDDNYKLSLKDSNGIERIYNISSGTKQVLLLSFISALAEISGFKFPIFIDTPLANTDNEQRINIAKKLPDFLKGNQVVLLVKDTEYTPKFRSLIKDRVSQEIKLEKKGAKTEVVPWN